MVGFCMCVLFLILFVLFLVIFLIYVRDYCYSDVYVYYVDFFQESEGMLWLLEVMDKGWVDYVMFSGVVVVKKWYEDELKWLCYYVGDDVGVYWYSVIDVIVVVVVKFLLVEQWWCVYLFLIGFNLIDKNVDVYICCMLELDLGFWQGIGEIFICYDDFIVLIYGDVLRVNNEVLVWVYYLVVEFDLLVLLYVNVIFKCECNLLYLVEIEEFLCNYLYVWFIWVYVGISMEIYCYQKKLDFFLLIFWCLLQCYLNFYIDLFWLVLCLYLLDEQGKLDLQWLVLVEWFL